MVPFRSLVIARQLEELRAEASGRRLVRAADPEPAPVAPRRPRPQWAALDDPAIVVPALRQYPFPIR